MLKIVQNVTQLGQKELLKVPSVARQMPAKCIFGHKNALCQSVADGRVDFQRGFQLVPACGALLYHGKRQLMV